MKTKTNADGGRRDGGTKGKNFAEKYKKYMMVTFRHFRKTRKNKNRNRGGNNSNNISPQEENQFVQYVDLMIEKGENHSIEIECRSNENIREDDENNGHPCHYERIEAPPQIEKKLFYDLTDAIPSDRSPSNDQRDPPNDQRDVPPYTDHAEQSNEYIEPFTRDDTSAFLNSYEYQPVLCTYHGINTEILNNEGPEEEKENVTANDHAHSASDEVKLEDASKRESKEPQCQNEKNKKRRYTSPLAKKIPKLNMHTTTTNCERKRSAKKILFSSRSLSPRKGLLLSPRKISAEKENSKKIRSQPNSLLSKEVEKISNINRAGNDKNDDAASVCDQCHDKISNNDLPVKPLSEANVKPTVNNLKTGWSRRTNTPPTVSKGVLRFASFKKKSRKKTKKPPKNEKSKPVEDFVISKNPPNKQEDEKQMEVLVSEKANECSGKNKIEIENQSSESEESISFDNTLSNIMSFSGFLNKSFPADGGPCSVDSFATVRGPCSEDSLYCSQEKIHSGEQSSCQGKNIFGPESAIDRLTLKSKFLHQVYTNIRKICGIDEEEMDVATRDKSGSDNANLFPDSRSNLENNQSKIEKSANDSSKENPNIESKLEKVRHEFDKIVIQSAEYRKSVLQEYSKQAITNKKIKKKKKKIKFDDIHGEKAHFLKFEDSDVNDSIELSGIVALRGCTVGSLSFSSCDG
eukprot:CAMPEP_0194286784 /NCGR_PEP_ID=MMETSP0169-20130528/33290_1 /TAXON_ID=218684 /ORGANISM="Corethron pennatum, Strain L29A3" /LENGTH=689 /DNA_ID=CAMNT_0039033299 /DNA_START=45 /DNA_END=2114 /DNA_ORIENTATION=-